AVSATAGPLRDLDDLPAALVEHDLGRRSAEGHAQRADAGAAKPPQGGVIQAHRRGAMDAPPDLVKVDAESGEQFAVLPERRLGTDLGADHASGDAQIHGAAER